MLNYNSAIKENKNYNDLTIKEIVPIMKLNIRGKKKEFFTNVSKILNMILATEANTSSTNDKLTSIWLSPDEWMIYSNDPTGYEKAMRLKKKFPNSFLIFNFLDVPWHMPNVDKQTKLLVEHFLAKSDAVTAISYKVKKDLAKFLDKKIEVIYNPIKDVFYDESIKKNNTFLYVGRANDPVKRTNLLKQAFSKTVNDIIDIKICGSEDPGFGTYLNVVSDQELTKLYNSYRLSLYIPNY